MFSLTVDVYWRGFGYLSRTKNSNLQLLDDLFWLRSHVISNGIKVDLAHDPCVPRGHYSIGPFATTHKLVVMSLFLVGPFPIKNTWA